MPTFATGPIDEDTAHGDIRDMHGEAFNITGTTISVTFNVYDLTTTPATLLGTETKTVDANAHRWFTVSTDSKEHVAAEFVHSGSAADVLFTIYGRNRDDENLPEATYRHTELVVLP